VIIGGGYIGQKAGALLSKMGNSYRARGYGPCAATSRAAQCCLDDVGIENHSVRILWDIMFHGK
jgi:hypothetical protein